MGTVLYRKQFADRRKTPPSPLPKFQVDENSQPSEASLRDPITNLYNRRHLLRRLQESMARCDRNKEKMYLILWDIDGFVHFNNQYGQSEGDQFLKKVADTIRNSIRIYDEAFRSGADEFCAILLPADESIATEVTERVGQTVSQTLFQGAAEYANQTFSVSAGVVTYPSEHKLPEALLYAAGQALYKIKSAHHV